MWPVISNGVALSSQSGVLLCILECVSYACGGEGEGSMHPQAADRQG